VTEPLSPDAAGQDEAVAPERRPTEAMRAFLFADVRGYTAIVERDGAQAAADLVDRYRRIVRAAVARHRGAEIRTEGDSFFVTFPAVANAVRSAQDIVAAATSGGIPVGIGIDAGETIATEDGFVGSAVNVAARLCALAAPGEILVTDTVRALSRSVVEGGFRARGRRQLKGVADPVAIFELAGSNAPARRFPSWRRLLLAGSTLIGGVALAAGLALTYLAGGSAVSPSDFPVPTPGLNRELEPGLYRAEATLGGVTFHAEAGWRVVRYDPDVLGLSRTEPPLGIVGVHGIRVVSDSGCPNGATRAIGQTPEAIAEWLTEAKFLESGPPDAVNIRGRTGIEVQATVLPIERGACGGRDPDQVLVLHAGDTDLYADPGDRMEFLILDVAGSPITIVEHSAAADAASFPAVARELVETIEFAADPVAPE
jgi:class 3 adenylate cyclase